MSNRVSAAWRALIAFVFGRDIFVSYSYKDSAYAEALAVKLGKRNFSVFLGAWGASPGAKFSRRVSAAVSYSHLLVVIATPNAKGSAAVEKEICAFDGRPVVPVDVGLEMKDPKTEWPSLQGTDVIREARDESGSVRSVPSDEVVARIVNSATFMRQETRLRRFLAAFASAVAILVLIAAGVAVWSRATARDSELRAANANTLARSAAATTTRVRGEATFARQESKLAGQQRDEAIGSRDEANRGRDHALVEQARATAEAEREAAIVAAIQTANEANTRLDQKPQELVSSALLAIDAVRQLDRRGIRALGTDTALRKVVDLLPSSNPPARYRIDLGGYEQTPDGRWIAEHMRGQGRIDLIDSESGRRVPLYYHPSVVGVPWAIALSDDGSVVAAFVALADAPEDVPSGSVVVWRVQDGTLLNTFQPELFVRGLAASRGGDYIAYAGVAKAGPGVRVVSANGWGAGTMDLPAKAAKWFDVSFSARGDVISIGGDLLAIWPWREGGALVPVRGDSGRILFNPADESMIAVETDGKEAALSLWRWRDLGSSDAKPLYSSAEHHTAAAFSNDGTTLATLSRTEPEAHVVALNNLAVPHRTVPLPVPGFAIAVANDGETIAVGLADDVIEVYRVSTKARIARMPHHNSIVAITMLDDGAIRSVSHSEALTWRPAVAETLYSQSFICAVSRDGKIVVTVRVYGTNSAIVTVDEESQEVRSTPTKLGNWMRVAVTNDGTLYGGMADGSVFRWDSVRDVREEMRREVAKEAPMVLSMAVSRGGRVAWAAGKNAYVMERTGSVRTLSSARDTIKAIAFAPQDDSMLVAGANDGDVLLWRLREDRNAPVATFNCGAEVEQVAIDHDGHYVAAACGDVKIWSTANPRQVWTLSANGGASLQFEPFGDSILAGSSDGVASVWSNWREKPMESARFTSTPGFNPFFARYSESGSHLITLPFAGDGGRQLWKNDLLIATACQRVDPLRDPQQPDAYDELCANVASSVRPSPPRHHQPSP